MAKEPQRATTRLSGKGALLQGMSRRLPRELLADPLFRKRLAAIMRRQAGIYALYDGDTPYYTGLTNNLFRRLRGHGRNKHAARWDHFVIFRISDTRYLKDIETLLHALIDTSGNRVHGKVPRDGDINRLLREELRNHQRKFKAYEKALR